MVRLLQEVSRAFVLVNFDESEFKQQKLDYLNEVQKFIMEGSYTDVKHKGYLLKNWDKPTKEQYEELDISRSFYYKQRKALDEDLEKMLGTEVVQLILQEEFNEVDLILDTLLADYSSEKVVIKSVVTRIEKGEHNKSSRYRLEECLNEIALLKKYSNLDLEVLLMNCDMSKLNYLLRLLDAKESDVKSRIRLIETIKQAKEGTFQ
ncbi:hypothetical protein [Bacillus toyonensis]|uniref:hypothetical protein n=1 Tax=Bacillus toyonensis TaxID=155322 RepID=UPI000BF6B286|nr:hypothetical protein [Bacillus toyonensis]PGF04997.1 hypothetical protein COM61_00740 [Bacillus toyonensis]